MAPEPRPASPRRAAPPRLQVAVVGVGGIGSIFASRLAQAGHAVTLVARPGSPRLAQLRRDRGVAQADGATVAAAVESALDESAAYDLVIVTTSAHQLAPLLKPLARSRASALLFMFNNCDPDALAARLAADRCAFGMPFVMARLDREGRLVTNVPAGRKTLHSSPRWAAVFEAAGLPSAVEPEMRSWLRRHVPMCIAMESVAVPAQRRGKGATWGEAFRVAHGLKAGFAIFQALGIGLHPSKKGTARAPVFALAAMLWSASRVASFRELLATGERECDHLIAQVAEAGRAGPRTPRRALEALLAVRPAALRP